jgi:hypothetical protein
MTGLPYHWIFSSCLSDDSRKLTQQDNLPVPSPDELAELDGAHKATSDEVKERKEDLRGLEKGAFILPIPVTGVVCLAPFKSLQDSC